MSAIFLSYSRQDKKIADRIEEVLENEGYKSLFVDRKIEKSDVWRDTLRRKLRSCSRVLALCTDSFMKSEWCFAEIYYAEALHKKIIPFNLGTLDSSTKKYKVLNLDRYQSIDAEAIGIEEGCDQLLKSLRGAGIFPWDPGQGTEKKCPYPGLEPLSENDASVFFGRGEKRDEGLDLLRKLKEEGHPRLLLIQGASGCGKSSLMRAGLVPALLRDPGWIPIPSFRPGYRPFWKLAEALLESKGRPANELKNLVERLRDPEGSLEAFLSHADTLRAAAGNPAATVLLVVDQLEEVLRGSSRDVVPNEASLFLTFLCSLISERTDEEPGGGVMILATLRSGFFRYFQVDSCLSNRDYRSLTLGSMSTESLMEVVEGPAQVSGLGLGRGVARALVRDTETEGSLSLLAFTLRELWKRSATDDYIELRELEEIGGIRGSVEKVAEKAIETKDSDGSMPDGKMDQLRSVFLRLVRIDEKGEYARAIDPASWSDLPAKVRPLLEKLVNKRLLNSWGDSQGRRLELAHEALLRAWPRLERWLREEEIFLRWRKKIDLKYSEWEESGRDSSKLLSGKDLNEAVIESDYWDDRLSKGLKKFIDKSIRRRRGKIRLLAIAGMLLTVGVSVLSSWAILSDKRASDFLRVTVATEWMARDRTAAALLLLEVDDPEAIPYAPERIRELARDRAPLAHLEMRGGSGPVLGAAFSPRRDRLAVATAGNMTIVWPVETPGDPVLFPSDSQVRIVAFSTQDDHLLTAHKDGSVFLHSINDPEARRDLEGHTKEVLAASFSPCGEYIVTASKDRTARVWSSRSHQTLRILKGHRGAVLAAAFDPDGRRVVTSSSDTTAIVWTVDASEEPLVLEGHRRRIEAVAFDPTGDRVVTASDDGEARVWTLDGSGASHVVLPHDGRALDASFSPDGRHVVTASDDGFARVWTLENLSAPTPLPHEIRVRKASFHPDGQRILTVSDDQDAPARIWEWTSPRAEPLLLKGHEKTVVSGSFSLDGEFVVTASSDGTARVWPTDLFVDPLALSGHQKGVTSVSFSRDGARLVTASFDGTARVWFLVEEREPLVLRREMLPDEDNDRRLWSASFNPPGTRIVTASEDGTATIWDLEFPEAARNVLGDHQGGVRAASFDKSGDRVITVDEAGTVRRWRVSGDPEGPEEIARTGEGVISASFNPTGSHFVLVRQNGEVWVGPIDESTAPFAVSEHGGRVVSSTLSTDARWLVTAKTDGLVRLLDLDLSEGTATFRSDYKADFEDDFPSKVWAAAIDPGGSQVASVSADGIARIWAAREPGKDPVELEIQRHEANMRVPDEALATAFSPDGKRLATTYRDGMVRVWRVRTSELRELLREATKVCLTPEFRMEELGEKPAVAHKTYAKCERTHDRTPRAGQ